MATAIKTTCPYCGTGCGLLVAPERDGDGWRVSGDADHPANFGRLCSKGAALAETLGLEGRLLHPEVDGRRVGWNAAIAAAADRIGAVIDRDGPDSFAFYLSGQLLTEDYYVANKLAKGWLGTANVDTNSRLCMASTVAGHRRAFGSDSVPGCYEDLETADLVVLVGSNLAWCHPVLFQRLRAAREAHGTRVVVIDPRRTDCCDMADLHIAVAPGGDVALFNGLLAYLHRVGKFDAGFLAAHVAGLAETLAAAQADASPPSPEVARFYRWFAETDRVVTVFSQGVNQSSAGTDKVNAIVNVHLATGRIGRSGCGPFSVTGQPNAMGGREVGGLANQLAAHMGFDAAAVDRVRRFWNAPRMATREGLKAVELFRAVDEGRVKALWIMATNPAVSLPDSHLVRRALAKCPVVIVSDCVAHTDTLGFAHIRLPALAWGEKDGTVTNSERTISRQRPFLPAPGEARPDWWAVARVAEALGFAAGFAWRGPAEIFREHARLSAFENDGSRDFDIGAAAAADYQTLAPFQWGGRRMFTQGRFFTPDGRARMVAVRSRAPVEAPSPDYPLRLNTGRYRDQWHTMTRTGGSARLSGHRPEPLIELHAGDAAAAGLADGALARLESRLGSMVARVAVTDCQQPGEVFAPMHWNDRFAADSVVGRLIPGHTDPVSGQPELKHVPVRLVPFAADWSALLIADRFPTPDGASWWVRHPMAGAVPRSFGMPAKPAGAVPRSFGLPAKPAGGCLTEMAGDGADGRRRLLAAADRAFGTERVEALDSGRGIARYAWMRDGRLVAALFVAPERLNLARGWLAGQLGRVQDTPLDRLGILAGRSPVGSDDDGRVVCACFSVGLATLQRAIRDRALVSVAEIGAVLKAGTGCGSCVAELHRLLPAPVHV